MKKILLIAVSLYMFPLYVLSQDITGLWKGTMYNDSTKTSLPYELLIKKEKGKLTGYTHSWFIIDGKEYYGIKTVKVSVAKEFAIVLEKNAQNILYAQKESDLTDTVIEAFEKEK